MSNTPTRYEPQWEEGTQGAETVRRGLSRGGPASAVLRPFLSFHSPHSSASGEGGRHRHSHLQMPSLRHRPVKSLAQVTQAVRERSGSSTYLNTKIPAFSLGIKTCRPHAVRSGPHGSPHCGTRDSGGGRP